MHAYEHRSTDVMFNSQVIRIRFFINSGGCEIPIVNSNFSLRVWIMETASYIFITMNTLRLNLRRRMRSDFEPINYFISKTVLKRSIKIQADYSFTSLIDRKWREQIFEAQILFLSRNNW